jgi:hypothetical protein
MRNIERQHSSTSGVENASQPTANKVRVKDLLQLLKLIVLPETSPGSPRLKSRVHQASVIGFGGEPASCFSLGQGSRATFTNGA